MRFRLLGPIEVTDHDRVLSLGGTKQRSLLALLLLDANEIVSTDRLIAELWADAPPATVAKSIQAYVSRLRAELGSDRLITRSPGYAVRVEPGELDVELFERLCEEARRAPPEVAAEKLREALSLWRGPPLGDLRYEAFAQAEIARLEELRASALEHRIDADLEAGRHVDLVGELQPLVAAHPHRERLHGQLMLALYRSGRQADALRVYQAARRRLSEELGLQPGAALRKLEQAILEQDPALDPPAPAGVRSSHSTPMPERSLLIVPEALSELDTLLSLAVPLASIEPPREIILGGVVSAAELRAATAALAATGDGLRARGFAVRTAAFSSPDPGADVASLASRHEVDLLVMDSDAPLEGTVGAVLERAPCDVAVLVTAGGPVREGPVVVPFGAAFHDWAALELGAWVARATGRPMRLVGAAGDQRLDGRDASRLLADASLILQRGAGVVAEPLLASPGRRGLMALARDAGLLVVGFSERWREEGLGGVRSELVAAPPAPTVLVLRGPRPSEMAPSDSRTRFGWSVTAEGD